MSRFTDRSPLPGEFVMVRSTSPLHVFRTHDETRTRVMVPPTAVGLLITHVGHRALVVFSSPCVVGWVLDGLLVRVPT